MLFSVMHSVTGTSHVNRLVPADECVRQGVVGDLETSATTPGVQAFSLVSCRCMDSHDVL